MSAYSSLRRHSSSLALAASWQAHRSQSSPHVVAPPGRQQRAGGLVAAASLVKAPPLVTAVVGARRSYSWQSCRAC